MVADGGAAAWARFAAIGSGLVPGIARQEPGRSGADFLAFLRRIDRVYPDAELHVVLDNA